MPYRPGSRLPGERAGKLNHLDVLHSPLVNALVRQFETPNSEQEGTGDGDDELEPKWTPFPEGGEPLRLVFAVDGSLQVVGSEGFPTRELAFVKTALLRVDAVAVERLDPFAPHPMRLKDILSEAALYHATAFPLRNLSLPGESNYNAIRKIIFESIKDESLHGEPMSTLKWLAYEKWSSRRPLSPGFQCPICEEEIEGLPYDAEEGECPHCASHVYLSDMLGFHLEMGEDSAPQSVASSYMLIHETLLLFTGIKHYWESNPRLLNRCLFVKDGPLTLRSQYSKLVIPIRRLFQDALARGITIHMFGQEKSGAFVEHLASIQRFAPSGPIVFAPSEKYIRTNVQSAPLRKEPYGLRTNYGSKLFVKLDDYHHLVLSTPIGEYDANPTLQQYIGITNILATLPQLVSHRHECALVPIVLANGVASLSTYPSAQILRLFAGL
ncbi:hypothetical protein [Deinococcus pimensis]|uniref:hypothetical protein n=1 Tax=Deinococcus pimensis TaxID=309888 RepID=UPI0004ADB546|nr:hypothetical protein [Deinococcus pimensis]